jgi:hypothetical protein
MFGQKFSKHNMARMFNSSKNFLGTTYGHAKNFLGTLDNGVKIGRQIYNSISPLLDKYVGGNNAKTIKDYVNKGNSTYDNIKDQVISKHNDIYSDYNNVKNKLLNL